jgi:transposase-like protein
VSELIDNNGARNELTATNEVRPRNRQKRYTTAYKLRILEEADRCAAPGELAALVRREGIYSSTIADFRKQKMRGRAGPNTPATRLRLENMRPSNYNHVRFCMSTVTF